MIEIPPELVADKRVGDFITIEDERFRLVTKTSTAVAVMRWYWYDDLFAWLVKKLNGIRLWSV